MEEDRQSRSSLFSSGIGCIGEWKWYFVLHRRSRLGSVFQYSAEEDHWTKIGEDISRRSCVLNTRCVSYLGNDGLFAQFICGFPLDANFIYRFNFDTKAWTELPQNIHDTHVGSLCLTVELEDKRPGVMMVGGHTLNQTSFLTIEHNTVEILDIAQNSWTMEVFDMEDAYSVHNAINVPTTIFPLCSY